MSSGLTTERSYRVLWAQVVLQAKEDLVEEPIGSLLYNDAKAFFLSGGEWARSRTNIADCLEMHPDDLGRCGKRWIAERRARDQSCRRRHPRVRRSNCPCPASWRCPRRTNAHATAAGE